MTQARAPARELARIGIGHAFAESLRIEDREAGTAVLLQQPRPFTVRPFRSNFRYIPRNGKTIGFDMSKEAMREEAERLVREAMERKAVTVKRGDTRIEAKCGKCGAPNRVSAAPGQVRVQFSCKECGLKQKTL